MSKTLYANVTSVTNPTSIVVSSSHSSSTSTAQITAPSKTVNIGDNITIDLGYAGDYDRVFKGYVKNISRSIPDDEYTIIAKDDMVRATDFFVVPSNPDDSYKWHNIKAETLISNVLSLAGLDGGVTTPPGGSAFTFATKSGNDVEVKLVACYDFCKMISDLLAWNLWADEYGDIYFMNRKPYPMDGTSGQVGDTVDETVSGYAVNAADPLDDYKSMNVIYTETDRELRNRVVVHGSPGIYAEAKSAKSWNPVTQTMEQILPATPTQFYKAMALVSPIIDNQSMADNSVSYNLDLYNKLSVSAQFQVEGDHRFLAREIIKLDEAILGLSGNWYIYAAEHQWSSDGYVTNLELRL